VIRIAGRDPAHVSCAEQNGFNMCRPISPASVVRPVSCDSAAPEPVWENARGVIHNRLSPHSSMPWRD